MISVIIPTFNRQARTSRAIESVLKQNIEAEIIVVDDGSENAFILEGIAKDSKNIRIIRKDKNQGAGAARNTGIEACSQPLISFLDSDDYLLPDTLEKRIHFAHECGIMENTGSFSVVGCGWQETDNKAEIIRTRHPKSSSSSQDFFSGCWFCPGSAIIMKRDLFTKTEVRFDEQLKRLEDLDLFMQLAQIGIRFKADGLTGVSIATSDSRYPNVIIKACDDIHQKYLAQGIHLDEKLQSNLKSYLFYELSRAHISKNEYHRAMDYLVKSFIQKPRLSLYPGPGWS